MTLKIHHHYATYIGTQAEVEAATPVATGAMGFATDLERAGVYDGAQWWWFENIPETFVPNTVTLNVGSSSDAVSDLQTILDGNIYAIQEAAATPGINLECNFVNITHINFIYVRAYYDGSATHSVRIQLYNYNTTTYDTFWSMVPVLDYQLLSLPIFPLVDSADYIDSGAAKVRFYHTESGNASHDLYIDYVAIGETT